MMIGREITALASQSPRLTAELLLLFACTKSVLYQTAPTYVFYQSDFFSLARRLLAVCLMAAGGVKKTVAYTVNHSETYDSFQNPLHDVWVCLLSTTCQWCSVGATPAAACIQKKESACRIPVPPPNKEPCGAKKTTFTTLTSMRHYLLVQPAQQQQAAI